MNMRSFVRLGLSLLACYGAGFLSALFVRSGSGLWYDELVKPAFTPDKLMIPLVWLVVYGLMAIALWIVWEEDPLIKEMRGWVPLFFAHLLINAAWAAFFFGFHAIFIALIDALILSFASFILIFGAYEIDKRAAYLLIPYAAWILFITYLNLQLWLLN